MHIGTFSVWDRRGQKDSTRAMPKWFSGPSLALNNGRVITVDERFSIASGLAIKGDRIIAVGSRDDIRTLVRSGTRVLDLNGATVLPGINDSHLHLASWATMRPPLALDVSYPKVKSIADVVEMVRDKADALAPGD